MDIIQRYIYFIYMFHFIRYIYFLFLLSIINHIHFINIVNYQLDTNYVVITFLQGVEC